MPAKSADSSKPANATSPLNPSDAKGSAPSQPAATRSTRPAQRNPFRSFVSTAPPGEEITNARRLPLALIDVNPHQARQQFDEGALDELTASIREHDVLQPIGVIQTDDRFRIIFGERRFRAAIAAEKTDIPAVIYEGLSEQDAAILTALENLQREDLDLEDEARQFSYLLEVTGLSQRALAERLGKTHNYISRRVRLLRDRPQLFEAIREGRITQREALDQLASEDALYHGDTADEKRDADGDGAAVSQASTPERQIGVYHGDTLVSVISMDQTEAAGGMGGAVGRTPRHEMPTPRSGVPARWQAITRTYRVLGKIQPMEVPLEECEDLAHQLEDLETLVSSTRKALEARWEARLVNSPGDSQDTASASSTGDPANNVTAARDADGTEPEDRFL